MNRQEIIDKLGGRRVIASVSGGKDSAALSLWLTDQGIEHERVFLDTGWEHPATYDYLRGELTRVVGPITELRGQRTMAELVIHKGMFPSRTIRFCTQELKVYPMQRYIRDLVGGGDDLVNAVGIRRGESKARSNSLEWEWSEGFDCEVWRPLVEWTEQQVIDIHRSHGLRPNPLYLLGARRVGCWPCIHSTKEELRMVSEIDPDRIDVIRELESRVVEAARLRAASRGEELKRPPAFFQLRRSDNVNRFVPIDRVIEWARTSHGGKQMDMFPPSPPDAGCMRWGLCDVLEDEQSADES